MSIVYQNVRGLNTKLPSIYNQSFDFLYDVIIFTETWLVDNVLNTEIFCGNYQIYRRDRGNLIKGGGVLIAVSNRLSSDVLYSEGLYDIEFIGVAVKLKHMKMFITCSYIPPISPEVVYMKHVTAIGNVVKAANQYDYVIALGDFNMPLLSWDFSSEVNYFIPRMVGGNAYHMDFVNSLLDLNLCQLNGLYNANSRLLDLIFLNVLSDISIDRCYPISLPEDLHHPTIGIEISVASSRVSVSSFQTERRESFCFKKTNYNRLDELLSNTNWLNLFTNAALNTNSIHINKMVDTFYKRMYLYMNQCIPKCFDSNRSGPPWNSKVLSAIKNKKNKFYKKYKSSGLFADYAKYSVARAQYISANRSCYYSYLIKVKQNLKCDPKTFYKFVNSKRRSSSFPSVMNYHDIESDNDVAICDLFADFFSSTYSDVKIADSDSHPLSELPYPPVSIPLLDELTVVNTLKKLKFSFNCGPDRIPSCLLVRCAEALSTPLTLIFNESIRTGCFPQVWKTSFIIPLYKNGSKNNIENYRGIAKLSTLPKLFEKISTDILSHQVSSVLSPFQHGFRKGCSTVTNLMQLTSLVHRGFRQQEQTDVIYTDFSKAFDKVNHEILLKKLDSMGFTLNCLKWIKSYLTDRTQNVHFKNCYSKPIAVLSGVPQGSHLGPLLFSLFINDLPKILKFCHVLMYADDVKIFLSYRKYADHHYLQEDLDAFSSWCNRNLMELNHKKCKCMSFFRGRNLSVKYILNGYSLDNLNIISDLGILLDSKLNFIQHISSTVAKARGLLGFIKRWAKEFSDPYITKQLYTSLVRPVLEYGSIIWDPTYMVHINSIESVQKQFLLFGLRGLRWNPLDLPPYTSRLALIKLPTLKSRRTMLNVTFVLNLLKGNVCSEFLISNIFINVPSRFTRHYYPLAVKVFRVNYANSEPLLRICKQFNKLYNHIDYSLNVDSVKSSLIVFLNS